VAADDTGGVTTAAGASEDDNDDDGVFGATVEAFVLELDESAAVAEVFELPPPILIVKIVNKNNIPKITDKIIFTILGHVLYFHIKNIPTG
jgi:hypothetical protein